MTHTTSIIEYIVEWPSIFKTSINNLFESLPMLFEININVRSGVSNFFEERIVTNRSVERTDIMPILRELPALVNENETSPVQEKFNLNRSSKGKM